MVAALVLVVLAGVLFTACGGQLGATTTSAANGQTMTTAAAQGSSPGSSSNTTVAPGSSATTTPTVQAQGEASPAQSVAKVLGPSVVNVKVSDNATVDNGFGQFGFGGQGQSQQYAAEGSGVIYRSDGMIITNNHVVMDEYTGNPVSSIKVTLSTGETLDATLVGHDPLTDIAVIKVKADHDLPAAEFVGTLPVVGEYAVAIGSPLGYANSVTLGIVSGLSRKIEGITGAEAAAYTNLIQTDAPISPGNSGGALANASGQVIGINVAYEPPNQTGAVSIGFAIPSLTAVTVADQLINSGKVTQGYLGIYFYPQGIDSNLQQQNGLSRSSGVLVTEVAAGGPAATAGVQQGDIIYKANGQDVNDPGTLTALVRDTKPGDKIELTIDRKGKQVDVTVTAGQRPATTPTTSQPQQSQ